MLSVVCIQGSSEEIFPRTRLAWSPVALIQIRGWIALSVSRARDLRAARRPERLQEPIEKDRCLASNMLGSTPTRRFQYRDP